MRKKENNYEKKRKTTMKKKENNYEKKGKQL